ncbi:MAG: hypothetical protein J7485_06185 [Sphingobium sp.]|nr:hypothetical protein [Sphingobium sp.]
MATFLSAATPLPAAKREELVSSWLAAEVAVSDLGHFVCKDRGRREQLDWAVREFKAMIGDFEKRFGPLTDEEEGQVPLMESAYYNGCADSRPERWDMLLTHADEKLTEFETHIRSAK